MITIQNDDLVVKVSEVGAQLHSVQKDGFEYLWQGDPASWKRQAPILFPFVGRLKDDQYEYQDNVYHQTQHGFARDENFEVVKKESTCVVLELSDNDHTRKVYPFSFKLQVTYQVTNNQLDVSYMVTNSGDDEQLIYSIGAHPGFNVPVREKGIFEDNIVIVDPAEKYQRIKLVAPGPFNDLEHPQSIDFRQPMPLDHDLFNEDAVVLKTDRQPVTVTVGDPEHHHGVNVITNDNQFIGIWSPYPANADLLCIEPWWGIADGIHSDGQLIHKQCMDRLEPERSRHYQFAIQVF